MIDLPAEQEGRERTTAAPFSRLKGEVHITHADGSETRITFSASAYESQPRIGLLRHYDPETGRWLSRDPLHEAAFRAFILAEPEAEITAFLSYCFVFNDSINFIDIVGLRTYATEQEAARAAGDDAHRLMRSRKPRREWCGQICCVRAGQFEYSDPVMGWIDKRTGGNVCLPEKSPCRRGKVVAAYHADPGPMTPSEGDRDYFKTRDKPLYIRTNTGHGVYPPRAGGNLTPPNGYQRF